MKKKFALVMAILSGIGLFIPDLLPIVDEAILLVIFKYSMQALGYDITKYLPFFGKKGKGSGVVKDQGKGPTIDV